MQIPELFCRQINELQNFILMPKKYLIKNNSDDMVKKPNLAQIFIFDQKFQQFRQYFNFSPAILKNIFFFKNLQNTIIE